MRSIAEYRPFGAFRLLLAALVVAQHFLANCAPDRLADATSPYEVGSVAVLVFFALSGFVICEAADLIYSGRPWAFLTNRLLRIAPHFIAAVALTGVLLAALAQAGPVRVSRVSVLDPATAFTAHNLAANAFGFLPFSNLAMRTDLLAVAWAVRIEMIFYLVVAAVLLGGGLARRRRPAGHGFAPAAAIAAAAMLPLFLLAMGRRAPVFLQLAPYFVFGGALYVARTRGSLAAWAVAAVSLALVAWEFGARPSHHPAMRFERAVTAQAILLAALLAAFAVLSRLRAGRFQDLDRSLGDLTYPLYVWHTGVRLVGLALHVEAATSQLVALGVLAVAVAILAHLAIDPAVDRLRDAIRGRRLRAPQGAAGVPRAVAS